MSRPDDHPLFRFGAAVLSEDIRIEGDGKQSLLGVLAGHIYIPEIPGAIKIALYVEVYCRELGDHKLDLRLSFGGETVVDMQGTLSVVDVDVPAQVALPGFPLMVRAPGELVLEVVNTGTPTRLLTRKVMHLSDRPTQGAPTRQRRTKAKAT